jgi:hypothetical protein
LNSKTILVSVTSIFLATIFVSVIVFGSQNITSPSDITVPPEFQSQDVYNEYLKIVSKYSNLFTVGQNIIIPVGESIYTRFLIFQQINFEGKQWGVYLEERQELTYNGIESGKPIFTKTDVTWDKITKLYLNTNSTILSGAGKFKIISCDYDSVTLKVLEWNPPKDDYKLR